MDYSKLIEFANACEHEQMKAIKMLQDTPSLRTSLYDNEETFLQFFVAEKKNKQVRFLVSLGFDVNVIHYTGIYPLFMSVHMNDFEISKLLLENKAKTDIEHDGMVPLFVAVKNGNLGLIRLLLEYGADSGYIASDSLTASNYLPKNRKIKKSIIKLLKNGDDKI